MLKKITLLVLYVLAGYVKAQQIPLYSQYALNDYIINPAVAGKNDYFEAKSTIRYQWIGITDAPRTNVISLNGPLRSKNIGLGGFLFTDVTGPTRRTGFYGSYAYHLKINDKMKLSFGLAGGLLQYSVDGSKIILHDAVDGALGNTLQSVLLPDFGFGAYLYSSKNKYYFGIAAPQLLQNKLKLYQKTGSNLSKLTTHSYVTGGYLFQINDDFSVEPFTLIKLSAATPVQCDIGARGIYQKKAWIGFNYRTKDAISMIAGYTHQDYLTIGYSYDFTTTNIRKYSSGTHEIFMGIKFNKK
jgi:type IX secretion system PorP/SprF family membrane protein